MLRTGVEIQSKKLVFMHDILQSKIRKKRTHLQTFFSQKNITKDAYSNYNI